MGSFGLEEKRLRRQRGNVRHRDVQGAHTPVHTGGAGQGWARLKWLPLPTPSSCISCAKLVHGPHKWPKCPGARKGQSEPQTLWQSQTPAPSTPNFPPITLLYPTPTILPFSKCFPSSPSRVIFSLPAPHGHGPSAGTSEHHKLPCCCTQTEPIPSACTLQAWWDPSEGSITHAGHGAGGCLERCELCPGKSMIISPGSPSTLVKGECKPQ